MDFRYRCDWGASSPPAIILYSTNTKKIGACARARIFCAAAHADGLINYNQPIISHAELVFCLQFGEKRKGIVLIKLSVQRGVC